MPENGAAGRPWTATIDTVLRESVSELGDASAFVAAHRDVGAKLICRTRLSSRAETVFAFLEDRDGMVVVTVRLQFWADERHPVFFTHSSDGDVVGGPLRVAAGRVSWPATIGRTEWGRTMHDAANAQWSRLLQRLVPRIERFRAHWFRALETEQHVLASALVAAHGVAPQLSVPPPSGFDGDGLTAARVLFALAGLGKAVLEVASVSDEEASMAELAGAAVRAEIARAFHTDNVVAPFRR